MYAIHNQMHEIIPYLFSTYMICTYDIYISCIWVLHISFVNIFMWFSIFYMILCNFHAKVYKFYHTHTHILVPPVNQQVWVWVFFSFFF